jgi:heptosyltransferase-1
VALRRWRRAEAGPAQGRLAELRALRRQLMAESYDAVIDAQGLYKSAGLALLARGPRHGLSFTSSRERFASFAYHRRHRVSWRLPAVSRLRQLFAEALDYPMPAGPADFGLDAAGFPAPKLAGPYVVLAHGTTMRLKEWPVEHWRALAGRAVQAGFAAYLPAHGAEERRRAAEIAAGLGATAVLPQMPLHDMAGVLSHAAGVASVDTGLGFLAAALRVPTVLLYGSTVQQVEDHPAQRHIHLASDFPCAPCEARSCVLTGSDGPPPCLAAYDDATVWAQLALAMHRP